MKGDFNEAAFPLREKTIVFTSDLNAVNRRQASAIARELGAKVSSEISPTTDFVVAGKKDDGGKLKMASERQIKVLSEDDFFALVKTQRKSQRELKGPQ